MNQQIIVGNMNKLLASNLAVEKEQLEIIKDKARIFNQEIPATLMDELMTDIVDDSRFSDAVIGVLKKYTNR